MTKINKIMYEILINQDIKWLEKQENSLENKHIKSILKLEKELMLLGYSCKLIKSKKNRTSYN
jgi:hypothetical protein